MTFICPKNNNGIAKNNIGAIIILRHILSYLYYYYHIVLYEGCNDDKKKLHSIRYLIKVFLHIWDSPGRCFAGDQLDPSCSRISTFQ